MLIRTREIPTRQDEKYQRNPIHYAAMSKFTNSFKTLEAILSLDIDTVPGFDTFNKLFSQLQTFEMPDETFDSRRCASVLDDFKRFMKPRDFNLVVKEFKSQAALLLKEVLNQQDYNQ